MGSHHTTYHFDLVSIKCICKMLHNGFLSGYNLFLCTRKVIVTILLCYFSNHSARFLENTYMACRVTCVNDEIDITNFVANKVKCHVDLMRK